MVCEGLMKRKKITIYHTDGTEEVLLSKPFSLEDSYLAGGITGIGYSIYDENNAQFIIQPTQHRKIKVEEIDV